MDSRSAAASGFPPGFLWGCATSAYQIEGSPRADGAGASIWDRFVRTPGRVLGGDTGDIACDHYRRMREDVALMRELGLTTYRFSIAWGRVMPEGRGRVNAAGLGFYERLVDELLRAGITPMATLYHWDLPAALDDRGGWLNPDIADWFADYAQVCWSALDDRVPLWATINEPWVVADGGYMHGVLAPGHRSAHEAAIAAHRLMQSHARAVQAYRAVGRQQIGLVVNIEPKHVMPDASEADRHAQRLADAYMNRQYLDPALLGRYPEELREVFGAAWPDWSDAEVEALKAPVDFLGLNYYTRAVVRHDAQAWPVPASPVRQPGAIYTETGWELHPQSLTDTLLWMSERYGGLPLYVTENGAAFYDPPKPVDGRVDDPLRVHYLRTHLGAVRDAIARGADVRGYCAWSLLDNLEWALGFAKRFGLVHVDFETLQRTPKASARFYADVIASHGAALDR
ncbi:GH1 family beta-glucosidase [Pelomonas sp. CA6]|uniref:GH1 family beta-glucosidase n=1 Tax=Pelomonas sp. CA6 TaxID=2907999 RepID=UPI001F4A6C80|nr:GH1 family beta-glucosidase [Pelomonas sp. CA6]MCH7342889.1 GH1 family beta-glucosidase [Pelomonas sp. CA6]